jgi:Uma2 family endonuclease
MSTVQVPRSQRLMLFDVDWDSYLRFLRAFEERPAWRLTYDHGTLEIMNISLQHASYGHLFGRFIVVLTEELSLPIAGGGSTTFKRRKKLRGLEPDECYWIAHEAAIRGKVRIDLRTDPPPDLALEVDVTHSSMDRMSIYASLRVPEVWRYDGASLTFNVIGAAKKYTIQASSATFPGLLPAAIMQFVGMRGQTDENEILRQFRAWVRQQIAAGVLTRPVL